MALPAGFRLFEYRIDGVLGQGAFGIAYSATDVNLNSRVVVKEYLPEDHAYRGVDHAVHARVDRDGVLYRSNLESFLVEARTLATFRHRNIVRVARFFEANRTAYMVLEYERGRSLKAWRPKRGEVPESQIVSLFAPLLDGLQAVHQAGYLHRDIKPDNLVVRDEDGSLVLIDFGAARQTASERAEPGIVVTPGYAALEQYAGAESQGPWTDIYGLGATLYWLVTGEKPVDAPQRMETPDPLPRASDVCAGRYSPEFLGAIDAALSVRPEERPRDVREFRSMLFAAHAGALGLQEALRRGEPRFWRAWRRPASWPLAAKVALGTLLTVMAPLIVASYYTLDRAQAHVAGMELRNLEQLAQSTAGRIAQLLGDSRNLADYVGTDEDFVAFLSRPTPEASAAILRKLQGLVAANRDIQFAMVMDPQGTAIVSTDPQVAGGNFRFREYFQQAMAGQPHMTGIIVGSVAGAAGVFYSRPVLSASGDRILGAVVVRIRAEPIGRMLADVQLGSQRTPFLIDGDGVIVWHPDEKLLFRSLVPLTTETHERILADKRFRRERIESVNQPKLASVMVDAGQPGNVSYYSPISARDEIAGFAPVPGHDWVVGVSESHDYFGAALVRLFHHSLYTVGVVGGLALVLALLLARGMVRRIAELTQGAVALKRGDYERAIIPVRANDEIGQLARTFNVMIDVLRQRERERGARVGGLEDLDDTKPLRQE
jgi:HAMP domain-containing protein